MTGVVIGVNMLGIIDVVFARFDLVVDIGVTSDAAAIKEVIGQLSVFSVRANVSDRKHT